MLNLNQWAKGGAAFSFELMAFNIGGNRSLSIRNSGVLHAPDSAYLFAQGRDRPKQPGERKVIHVRTSERDRCQVTAPRPASDDMIVWQPMLK
jgi:hypothetical protein